MTLSEKFPLPLLPSYLPRSLPSSFLVAALNAPFNPSYLRALIHSRLPVLKYCFLRHGVRLNQSANRLKPANSICRQACISQIVFARRSGTFCNLPSFFDSLKMPGLYLTAPTLPPSISYLAFSERHKIGNHVCSGNKLKIAHFCDNFA